MFLIKKIGSYFYAYSPKGFIIDYSDYDYNEDMQYYDGIYYKKITTYQI